MLLLDGTHSQSRVPLVYNARTTNPPIMVWVTSKFFAFIRSCGSSPSSFRVNRFVVAVQPAYPNQPRN